MIEIKKDTSEDYTFVLRTESGDELLSSIVYSNRIMVEEAVHCLKTVKASRNTIERKTNHSGNFLFSLKDKNGELIGNSKLYLSEAGMENGIKNIINRINFLSDPNQL